MSQSMRGQHMRDSHRMFLQSFMSRSVLNGPEVFALLKDCCDRFEETEDEDKSQLLVDFCRLINDHIKMLGMEIKKGVDEFTGKSFYGLVNTQESTITLFASQYNDNELEFFKKLIEDLVKSENGTVGSIAAINISDNLGKKMSKNDAERLLERFEQEGWICKTNRGKVYLGTRGLLEMDQYIFEMFEDDATRCNGCKKLCIQGQRCDQCLTKLHKHCATRLFKNKSDRQCPECRTPWTGDASNDSEDAVPESQSSQDTTVLYSRKRKATT